MVDFKNVTDIKGWFSEWGPEYDVAISSRIRLSRNLVDFPYPGMMSNEDEVAVQNEIRHAFSNVSSHGGFEVVYLNTLSPLQRRILFEQNIITQSYSLESQKAVILSGDNAISGMINETDHIRLASLHGGVKLRQSWEEINNLDSELEQKLNYAVSIDMGYLNTELANTGTGMRASIMLHLPAMVQTSIINKAFKTIARLGFSLQGFFSDDDDSLGDMYQIGNELTLGVSEDEILDRLENVSNQIIEYERNAREELVKKGATEFEDKIWRALGILKYSRSISSIEAIDLLSRVRLGICLGIVKDVSLETVTSLLVVLKKSHVQYVLEKKGKNSDSLSIDKERAECIRSVFSGVLE